MRLQLIDKVEHRARETPGEPALTQAGGPPPGGGPESLAWAYLARAARHTAARLARDVPPGGVVLLVSPNRPEFVPAFLGILAAGARAFPVSPELADAELAMAAARSGAVAMIGTDEAIAAVGLAVPVRVPIADVLAAPGAAGGDANCLDRDHATAALLLQSSGTTGLPKIVVRGAASLDAVSGQMGEAIGFTPADRVLACVPLCHSYGIEHGLLAPLWAGTRVDLCRGFDLGRALVALESGATILPGVPFMFEMLARHGAGRPAPALRRAYSAGGPLPAAVATTFQERFGVPLSQLYGATEIGSVTYADPDLSGYAPASVGRAMRGVDVRILEVAAPDVSRPLPPGAEGQVAVRAASMLDGYLGEAVPPTLGGYFLTGDLGRLDDHGNLTLTGRLKLLIDVAGLKVNPLEVEAVLADHPSVAACVVVPVRVSETVSRVKAIVEPRAGAAELTPETLRQFARDRLAGYKVPRVFEVRAALPRSPAGKVLRHLVEA